MAFIVLGSKSAQTFESFSVHLYNEREFVIVGLPISILMGVIGNLLWSSFHPLTGEE